MACSIHSAEFKALSGRARILRKCQVNFAHALYQMVQSTYEDLAARDTHGRRLGESLSEAEFLLESIVVPPPLGR